jgi:selenocysteine lyase/cysteine desulfurase
LFPVLNSCTYLNTAYAGPLSTELFDFRKKLENDYLVKGDVFVIDRHERISDFRNTISKFINSSKENTFFTSNFSTGYRYILDLLPKKSKILALENDYNSLLEGLKEREFTIDHIPITSDFELQIENKLYKNHYDVLVISVVQFLSGIKVDFNLLRKIKSAFPNLIIIGDSTQFIGSDLFDFNNSPFDVIIGSGYKWMLAGFGNAYLAVSERFFNYTKSSSKILYDKVYTGHINFLGSASLDFAIKFLQKNNFESLIQQKNDLGAFLGDELKRMKLLDPEVERRKDHSSIYTIVGDRTLHDELQRRGVRCSLRGKGVRVSVHFYNEEYEVDNLIKILKKLN